MAQLPDEYLGDGVYASHDPAGYIWLDCRQQPMLSRIYVADGMGGKKPTMGIALDRTVVQALERYVRRIEAACRAVDEALDA